MGESLPQGKKPVVAHEAAGPVQVTERDKMKAFAEPLLAAGKVTREQIKQAWDNLGGQESAARFKKELVGMTGLVENSSWASGIVGVPTVSLRGLNIDNETLDKLTPEQVVKYRAIPFKIDGDELQVAIDDPNNVLATDALVSIVDLRISLYHASSEDIDWAIGQYYVFDETSKAYDDMVPSEETALKEIPPEDTEPEMIGGRIEVKGEATDVVRFVDLMFREALYHRASDIHIEPVLESRTIENPMAGIEAEVEDLKIQAVGEGLLIRYRIDGVLYDRIRIPMKTRKLRLGIVSRLKVMAGLDISEKRVPQDGRIAVRAKGAHFDLRVSSLPTNNGESLVMRLLDQTNALKELEQVGFLPGSIALFAKMAGQANGLVLVTGPTGSGKTTTLYAALKRLNTPDRKIVTLEDPIEYMIPGLNQVQINAEVGLTFPVALRSVLRQAPNIILVGEIRDKETAENALRAAQTGHLVFSTLHTNDAPGAISRLLDLGVEPSFLAGSLQGVVAQRLVRRVCQHCRQPVKLTDDTELAKELRHQALLLGKNPDDLTKQVFFVGQGCERCGDIGYRGRLAIHEVMPVYNQPKLRRAITQMGQSGDKTMRQLLRYLAKNQPGLSQLLVPSGETKGGAGHNLRHLALSLGMRSLADDGFEKVKMGQTTMEDILREAGPA